MLKIDARHRLVGEHVAWQPTPNVGGAWAARHLVMHYTAGGSAQSAITRLAPFNVVTWHAGVSQWDGIVGLNSASIEMQIERVKAARTRAAATR